MCIEWDQKCPVLNVGLLYNSKFTFLKQEALINIPSDQAVVTRSWETNALCSCFLQLTSLNIRFDGKLNLTHMAKRHIPSYTDLNRIGGVMVSCSHRVR